MMMAQYAIAELLYLRIVELKNPATRLFDNS